MAGKDDFVSITERIDEITGIPRERMDKIISAPKSVKIEMTARCNLRCRFCAVTLQLREMGHIDRDFYERIALEMREAGVEELGMFFLGESFLVPWLDEAIYYARHTCGFPYLFLTTNGFLATPDRVESLIRAGLDSLKFSLFAADRDQYAEITQVSPRGFDALIENIKAAHEVRERVYSETGHYCGLAASSIKFDAEQEERMQEVVAEVSPFLDTIYQLPLYSVGSLVDGPLKDMGLSPTPGNMGRLGCLRDPLPCWQVFTEGHISWNGFLTACAFSHDESFYVGDLKEKSFMDCWNGEEMQALRREHISMNVDGTVCEKCAAYEL